MKTLIIIFLLIPFAQAISTTHLVSDPLNSPVIIGKEKIHYSPFGKTITKIRYTYNAKEIDKTNLSYFGARYLSTKIARFFTPDTIQGNIKSPQELNRFTYVKNNPLNRIDPTGNQGIALSDATNVNLEKQFQKIANEFPTQKSYILSDEPKYIASTPLSGVNQIFKKIFPQRGPYKKVNEFLTDFLTSGFLPVAMQAKTAEELSNLEKIGSTYYEEHALQRLEDRKIMPSVVESVIKNGEVIKFKKAINAGEAKGATRAYFQENIAKIIPTNKLGLKMIDLQREIKPQNIYVLTDEQSIVKTVYPNHKLKEF